MSKIRSGNRLVVCPMIYGGASSRQARKSNPLTQKPKSGAVCWGDRKLV